MTNPIPTPVRAGEDAGREAGVLRCACNRVEFPALLEAGVRWQCPCGRSSMGPSGTLSAEARASAAEAEIARLKVVRDECERQFQAAIADAARELDLRLQAESERDAAISVQEMCATSGGFYARHSETATKRAEAAEAEASALRERVTRLEDALTFYADPEVYKPHPHGPAFDRRDISYVARAALTEGAPTDV